ncbi:hypothetical protein DB32_005525 [Sandaracinus amylolyticus]|uniref:Uncharacterized protein n=2 Tax=Sandaracinus amylolyticus TaxID=927083 RepID=A0A0F6YJR6_9BACT|nr:hypothetical protein DB32_005525 [Sandaracinus amylolyticus]
MEEELHASARALAEQLAAAGIDASVRGEGVHRRVVSTPVEGRSVLVHCFWYERAIAGRMIGLNPANARSRLHAPCAPYEGPEYLVIVRDHGVDVADGRTRDAAEAVLCARLWSAGVGLDELVRHVPFIDEHPRAMRALARRIDPRLHLVVGGDLWAYAEDRACEVTLRPEGMACRFLVGQVQVALGAPVDDVPGAVAAWLLDGLSVAALARVAGVEIERHAEVLETDPARWHWLHVRDRIANPHDVLAPLRELLAALAQSPIATRFYSYSSLSQLCFSASSHHPWVDADLPVIAPGRDGTYLVHDRDGEPERCGLRRAVERVEATLARSKVPPFFGSAPHWELPLLTEALARQGSALRPELVRTGEFHRLVVADSSGVKQCDVDGLFVTFSHHTEHVFAHWPTLDEAVVAIRRYLGGGTILHEIAADPHASRRGKYVPPS